MKIGYARVSTTDQSLDIQLAQLKEAGCEKIFHEKWSAKSTDGRDALSDAIEYAREGDVLLVTKLDRLARSVPDLHSIMTQLDDKGAKFTCLNQPVDTTTAIGKLMVQIVGAFAEFELDIRKERQAEGIAQAKARGAYTGRKKTIDDDEVRSYKERGLKAPEIAKIMDIGIASVYRALR